MSEQQKKHDPARMITMVTTRPMYLEGKVLAAGAQFELRADQVPDAESSRRCKIADPGDRPLVYRKMVSW